MYGRGGRIGLAMLDSDLTIEADLRRVLPDGVEIHAARVIYPKKVSAENMSVAAAGLDVAIDSLLPVRPSAIGWACTSGSFYGGVSGHRDLMDRMRLRAGEVPVTTASESVVEALRAVGARRPAVGAPYSPDMNRRLAAFLSENGMQPTKIEGLYPDVVDDFDLQDVEDEQIAAFLLSLNDSDCDAVVLSCTGMPTAAVAPQIEQRIGKPVITSNLAILWNCWRMGACRGRPVAENALFRTLPS